MAELSMADVREYARLRSLQQQHQAAADEVQGVADALEQSLLEGFAEAGVQSMSVDGRTVYLERKLWARVEPGASRDQVIEGLRRAGLDHFVQDGYNSNTVSAWLRELESSEEPIPPALEGVLGSTEVYRIRTRRA